MAPLSERIFVVLLLSIYAASDESARDCDQIGSCSRVQSPSLLATKMSVTRGAVKTGSLSIADISAATSDVLWFKLSSNQESLGETEMALRELSARVIAGTEKLTDGQKGLLKSLKEELEKIKDNLAVDHAEDQTELNTATQAIEACDGETSVIAAGAASSGTAMAAIDTCKEVESQNSVTNTASCDAYTAVAGNPSPPTCMASFDSEYKSPVPVSKFDAMITCVGEIHTWAKGYHATLVTKKSDCDTAASTFTSKKEECDEAQKAGEMAFCSYRQTVVTACASYEACRATAVAEKDKSAYNVKIDEGVRKVTQQSIDKVTCYLGVLEAGKKDGEAKLKECMDLVPTTSHLDITYPATPAGVGCSTSAVTTYPCEAAWISTHYSSKGWSTNAPAEACTPCTPLNLPGGGGQTPMPYSTGSMVAAYLFNGNTDDALGVNHATSHDITYTDDRHGNANSAIRFGATPGRPSKWQVGSWVQPPELMITGLTDFSWCAWLNFDSKQEHNWNCLFSHGYHSGQIWYGLDTNTIGTGYVRFRQHWGNTHCDKDVGFGAKTQWNHLCVVGDRAASTTTVYANGVNKGSCPNMPFKASISETRTNMPPLIGTYNQYTYQQFRGMQDDVLFYSRQLTSAEIAQIHTANPSSPPPPPASSSSSAGVGDLPFSLSFDDGKKGECPVGWSCSGVELGASLTDKADEEGPFPGGSGLFLKIFQKESRDGEPAAYSPPFYLPAGATKVTFERGGVARGYSGLYIKRVRDNNHVCEGAENHNDKPDGREAVTSCTMKYKTDEMVYFTLKDNMYTDGGVYIDDIKFHDDAGNVVASGPMSVPPISFTYEKQGPGFCNTKDGRRAQNVEKRSIPENKCKELCDNFRGCRGYSHNLKHTTCNLHTDPVHFHYKMMWRVGGKWPNYWNQRDQGHSHIITGQDGTKDYTCYKKNISTLQGIER